MTLSKHLLAAAALVAMASTVAIAQTDFGSPLGAGAGVGGAVAPFGVPGAAGSGTAAGLTGPGAVGLANARAAFASAASNGVTVPNPAGGNVTLAQDAALALGAVLGGSATPAQSAALANALTGVPAARATALVTALASLGSNASIGNLGNAISQYNAAIDALPAGALPAPAMHAVRQALFAASR
jgi:hypothetical protein